MERKRASPAWSARRYYCSSQQGGHPEIQATLNGDPGSGEARWIDILADIEYPVPVLVKSSSPLESDILFCWIDPLWLPRI